MRPGFDRGALPGAIDAKMRRRGDRKPPCADFNATFRAPAIFIAFHALQRGDDPRPLQPPSPMRLLRHFLALDEIDPRNPPHRLLIENHDRALVAPDVLQVIKLVELRQKLRPHIGDLCHHEFCLPEG